MSSPSTSSSSSNHLAIFRVAPSAAPPGPPTALPKPRIELRSLPKPTISKGELLVRVAYAAIQPGDVLWLQGAFKLPRETIEPYAGASAAGVVEDAAPGLEEYRGKAVMICKPLDLQPSNVGTWTEYARIVPNQCAVIPSSVLKSFESLQNYSGSLANLCTAWTFLHEHVVPTAGAGVLITAGAGATGRAMLAFSARLGVRAVAIVRSAADAERLRSLQKTLPQQPVEGKDWWLVRSDIDTFAADAAKAIAGANATVVFDCVTGQILNSLLPVLLFGTQIFVYSVLDRSPISIPGSFLMQKQAVLRTFGLFRSAAVSDPSKLPTTLKAVSEAIEGGYEHYWTFIDKIVPANKAEDAVRESAEKYHTKRIVLDFTSEKAGRENNGGQQ